MIWIVLAISAAFLWATGNVISKYALFKINKETAMIGMVISGLIVAGVVYAVFPVSFSAVAFFTGILWYGAYYLFFAGLDDSEVSRMSALLLTNPIFTAIFSAFMLGEILTITQYFGILMAVCGALLISIDGRIVRKGALMILASSIVFSLSDIGSKIAINEVGPISVLFGERLMAVPFLLLFIMWRNRVDFKTMKLGTLAIGTGLISDVASYFFILACSLTFVSLVTAFTTTQAIFVFLGATFITKLNHKLLEEDISRKSLVAKALAIILLILGVVLVAL